MIEVKVYKSEMGVVPFDKWLDGLRSSKAKTKIAVRIARIERGTLGDTKPVGDGVHEVRINFEKGYRLYFANDGQQIIVLLCGSYKGDQKQEIKNAKEYYKDYLRQKKNAKTN